MSDESGLANSGGSSNVTASSLIWGRLLFATSTVSAFAGSSVKVGSQHFLERVCTLKLGFFLEVKASDTSSGEPEVHAICVKQNNIQLVEHPTFGAIIHIQKQPNCHLFLAQKGAIGAFNPTRSANTYLCAPWSENSIFVWYILLKTVPRSTSLTQGSCLTVMPKSESRYVAFCSVLTSADFGSLCSVLPPIDLTEAILSGQINQVISRVNSIVARQSPIVFKRCFSQAYPYLPPYEVAEKPVLFNVNFHTEDEYRESVLQAGNIMTDVHFLSIGSTFKYIIEEQIFGSPLVYFLPYKLMFAFIKQFEFRFNLLSTLCRSERPKNVDLGYLLLVLPQMVEFLRDMCAKLYAGVDLSSFLKKSDWKNDKWSLPIPLNLQVYRTRLCEMDVPELSVLTAWDKMESQNVENLCSATQQRLRANDEPVELKMKELSHWDIVTVGCPTPHSMDYGGTGRSYTRFEELTRLNFEFIKQLIRLDPSITDYSKKFKDPMAPYTLVLTEQFLRRDMVSLSLTLTPLCVALVRAIENSKDDLVFWKILIATKKVNFSWTSFINDNGNEYEMLKDFVGAVQYVNTFVKFVFFEGDSTMFPDVEIDLLGDIVVRVPIPKSSTLSDQRSVFVSEFLEGGKEVKTDCCVHFLNQRVIPAPSGADASSATNAFGGKVSPLQTEIFRSLHESFVQGHLKETIEKLDSTFGQGPEAELLVDFRSSLTNLLTTESVERTAKFPANIEHVHGFVAASRLSRCIRLTSCKSAKDRSSMSSTFEMSKMICDYIETHQKSFNYHKKDQIRTVVVESLRQGVRLKNCKLNCGKARYKFQSVNHRLLPQEFKPPERTYTNAASVSS